MRHSKKIIVIAPLLLILVGSFLLGIFVTDKKQVISAPATAANFDAQVLGSSQQSDKSILSIMSSTRPNKDSGDSNLASQLTYTVSLKNNSVSQLEFSPGLNTHLIGIDGVKYFATLKFRSNDIIAGGPIMPGESKTFEVDFDVPPSISPKNLVYTDNNSQELQKIEL